MQKNIYVLYGGPSTEHEVSITSARTLINNLSKEKYNVSAIFVRRDKKFIMKENITEEIKSDDELVLDTELSVIESVSECIRKINPENTVIFPAIHGSYGEDGTIQGFIKVLDLPFVGCNVLGSALCMDKGYTNDIFELNKIPQAKYVVLCKNDDYNLKEIFDKTSKAVYVKPCNAGSSVGVMRAETEEELEKAIQNAFQYDRRILVEEEIIGPELQIAVMGNDNPVASRPGVYQIHDVEFFDYDAKYNDSKTEMLTPFPMDEDLELKARHLAEKVYKLMSLSGFSRVDMFVKDNELWVNEINTVPGLTPHSMFPVLWKCTNNMSVSEVFDNLIDLAVEEYEKNKAYKLER